MASPKSSRTAMSPGRIGQPDAAPEYTGRGRRVTRRQVADDDPRFSEGYG